MIVEVALYNRLSTFAGLTALVSTRIYPLVMPQAPTLPAVTYQKVSAIRPHTMQTDPTCARARFQFTVWAASYSDARDVAKQIQAAIQNEQNELWGGAGGVTVSVIGPENESDGYERLDSGTELFSRSLDFIIFHDSD